MRSGQAVPYSVETCDSRHALRDKLRTFSKSHPPLLSIVRKFLSFHAKTALSAKIARKRILKFVDRQADGQQVMINIGGGYYFRRHWRVLDCRSEWYNYKKRTIDFELDLMTGDPFPFPSNSVYLFYSSHTLEHIPQEYCQHILNEIYRCLKPAGGVRITVPDFDLAHEAFLQNSSDFFVEPKGACIEVNFLNFFATHLKETVCPEELRENCRSLGKEELGDYYTQQISRCSQKQFSGNHINWWNYEKLDTMLKRAGFHEINRSSAQCSRFTEMQGEGMDCGFDSTFPEMSLFIEAVK